MNSKEYKIFSFVNRSYLLLMCGWGWRWSGSCYCCWGALACAAAAQIDAGVPTKKVESSLGMHPFAASQLISKLERTNPTELHEATIVLADLEIWCRGGAAYGDQVALTLALRRAAGAAA